MTARRLRLTLVAAVPALAPGSVAACATCLDAAWGNRGFGWPFVALTLAPFAVAAGLAAVLAWGWRRRRGPAAEQHRAD